MLETKFLKNKFNEEILQAVEESKKIGYIPTRFIQMLQLQGNNAFEVVSKLVTKEATTGLEKLWEKGRLDLSVEAVMIKNEYRELFDSDVIKVCEKKLKSCGYKI